MLGDVFAALHGVLQRIGLGGILLGFHQQPAFVVGLGQNLEDGIEVHAAVAGNGEGTVADSLQEAPVVLADFVNHGQTHVLQMDVAHAVHILLQHDQGIFTGEGEVAGVEAQEHIAGISVAHHAVGFLAGLHHGAHVMMEAQLEAALGGDLAQGVQTCAEAVPLLVVHDVLVAAGQNGGVHLALNGVALLAHVDAVGADSLQEIQVGGEVSNLFLDGAGQNERGVPAAGNTHAAQIQSLLQLGGIRRILVADLAAGEAGQSHFADDLLEGVLATQFGHVVIAPADRGDAKGNALGIKHENCPP